MSTATASRTPDTSEAAPAGAADDWRDRAVKVLPTEHFTLQSARSATIADSSSRASLYLGAVSLGLVALGLVAQASDLGTAFNVFGLVLFPTLFYLGLTTFVRVAESSVEDMLYARGTNRIRHFYQEFVPEAAPYFILSANDDSTGVLRNMGLRPTRWQIYLTTAGTIGVINSVLAAAGVGMAVDVAGAPLWADLAVGAAVFALSAAAHIRALHTIYAHSGGEMEVHFPSPPDVAARVLHPDAPTDGARG